MPQTQMQYLCEGEVDREYWPQLQGQLFVTGRQWVDIKAFNPEMPRCQIRVERDVAYIACLEKLLNDFNAFILPAMAKIIEMQPLRKGAKFYQPVKGVINEPPKIQY